MTEEIKFVDVNDDPAFQRAGHLSKEERERLVAEEMTEEWTEEERLGYQAAIRDIWRGKHLAWDDVTRIRAYAMRLAGVTRDKPAAINAKPFQQDPDLLNAPRPRWAVKGLWLDSANGWIAGIPKTMKSWIALDLAFSLASGTNFLGQRVIRRKNVLYLQQEDSASMVKDRLQNIINAKAPQYHWHGHMTLEDDRVVWYPPEQMRHDLYVKVQTGFNVSDDKWRQWLAEFIVAHDIEHVVMDTLSTIASGVDLNSAEEARAEILNPLTAISEKWGCGFTIVHHNPKSEDTRNPGQRLSGTGQLHAWAECGLYVVLKEPLTIAVENKGGPTRRVKYDVD